MGTYLSSVVSPEYSNINFNQKDAATKEVKRRLENLEYSQTLLAFLFGGWAVVTLLIISILVLWSKI